MIHTVSSSRTNREDRIIAAGRLQPTPRGRGVLEVPSFGRLFLTWGEHGLIRIAWEPSGEGEGSLPGVTDVPLRYADPLRRYFASEPVDPAALPVELHGTPFQLRVWGALRRVPRGQVRTYAEIAQAVGSPGAMRAVGTANGANRLPLVVPCHRIVAAGGRLGGYSGGRERKAHLLRLEGARLA